MEYVQKLNHFSAARTWQLDHSGLNWSDSKGESGRIAYTAITAVRLRFEPSRAERRRFAMRIRAGSEYVITNINYRGVLDFEDQSSQFSEFVRALHGQLSQANPQVAYQAGSTAAAFAGNLFFMVFVAGVLLAAVLFLVFAGMLWLVAVKVLLILFYLPTALKVLRRNRPGTYDPLNIPPALMPA